MGSFTLAGAVTAGLLALNEAPSWGFTAPATLAIAAVCITSFVVFVIHERRAPRPLIPLRYFRMRNFVFPLGSRTFTNFAYMGGFFLFPILMERIYGYSETRAGLVSTARPLMFSIVAPIAGYAAVKVGERLSAVAGAVSIVASMVVFTQLGAQPSLVVIVVALALSGVGNGLSTPSTASSASNEVAADELGVMSAAQQLITQIGIVAGIQVMVTVQAGSHGGVGSLASFHRAYAVGAVGAVLAAVCGLFMRNTPGHGRAPVAPESGTPGP
jgi:predicted MFS family arabinose efflux permease